MTGAQLFWLVWMWAFAPAPQGLSPTPGGLKGYSGGAPVVCGDNSTGHTNTDSGNNNFVHLSKCTTGANANGYSVGSVSLYVKTAGGNIQGAVYASSAGAPTGSELCSTASTAASANQDNTITISGCGTLTASTLYFVAWNNNTAGIQYGEGSAGSLCTTASGAGYSIAKTFLTWGSAAAANANGCKFDSFMTVTPL